MSLEMIGKYFGVGIVVRLQELADDSSISRDATYQS
jgi:hypothetical protein